MTRFREIGRIVDFGKLLYVANLKKGVAHKIGRGILKRD